MKKLILGTLVISGLAVGKEDVGVWFGIGQNNDLSMEIGYSYGIYGANIYNAGNYDYKEGDVNDSKPPHSLYRVEEDRVVGGAIGLDVMLVPKWKIFRPFIEGGIVIKEKRDIAVSQNILDYGQRYTLSKKTKISFGAGAGLQVVYKWILIGVELHTEKGVMGQIGLRF